MHLKIHQQIPLTLLPFANVSMIFANLLSISKALRLSPSQCSESLCRKGLLNPALWGEGVGIKCCTMRFAFNWEGILFLDNLFIALTFQNCFNPCIFSIF